MIITYFILISAIAFFITVYDKIAAKKEARRISEKSLLLIGLAGGASVMYVTMQIIRHKTLHAKFMILLPLMIILHIVLCYFILGGRLAPETIDWILGVFKK